MGTTTTGIDHHENFFHSFVACRSARRHVGSDGVGQFGLALGARARLARGNESAEASPDAAEFVRRGSAHYEQGDLAEAIADFTNALNLEAENPAALRGRAEAYCDNGDLEKRWRMRPRRCVSTPATPRP